MTFNYSYTIDIYGEEVGSSTTLEYDSKGGYFTLVPNLRVINSKLGRAEDHIAFFKEEFEKIFPEYDPNEHAVIYDTMGNETFYNLLVEGKKETKLPLGSYQLEYVSGVGVTLKPFKAESDVYVDLDNHAETIFKDIKSFFGEFEKYENNGLRHRRAALLYGDPGNGKTATIVHALKQVKGVITIYVSPRVSLRVLLGLKPALEKFNTILVFEELTERTREEDLSDLLNFLDGADSWVNTYVIATTNYPETLPDNVIDRPGRFEVLVHFESPNREQRAKYLGHFGIDSPELLAVKEKLSIDYLRYIVLQHKLTNQDPFVVYEKLKKMRTKHGKTFKGGGGSNPFSL